MDTKKLSIRFSRCIYIYISLSLSLPLSVPLFFCICSYLTLLDTCPFVEYHVKHVGGKGNLTRTKVLKPSTAEMYQGKVETALRCMLCGGIAMVKWHIHHYRHRGRSPAERVAFGVGGENQSQKCWNKTNVKICEVNMPRPPARCILPPQSSEEFKSFATTFGFPARQNPSWDGRRCLWSKLR